MSEVTVGTEVYRKSLTGSRGVVTEIYTGWYCGRPHARVQWHAGNCSTVLVSRLVSVTEERKAEWLRKAKAARRQRIVDEITDREKWIPIYRARGDEEHARAAETVLAHYREKLAQMDKETP